MVDTGAEISVISDQLRYKLEKINSKLPTLPVMGITVNGVILNQTTKVRQQIMVRIKIYNATEHITFLLLDGLVEEGKLGNDFLDSLYIRKDGTYKTIYAKFAKRKQNHSFNYHTNSTRKKKKEPQEETPRSTTLHNRG